MTDAIESGFFDVEQSADVVIARNASAKDARLARAMAIITRHLHAAVKEIEPTQDEWMQAVQFLTRTGQACTDWRQEYILLSDVLGVSMLVDAINHPTSSTVTESTVLGPFYVPDAPHYPHGFNIALDGKGEPLAVFGRVTDEAGQPIADAIVDVWQSNDEGFYDVQQKGIQPEFNLRGVFRTDKDGRYWFRAMKPRCYPIPDDGPAGQLLQRLGRHCFRPAHIHYFVRAEGYRSLVTHFFDPDDAYIASDAVFGVKESLMSRFIEVEDRQRVSEVGFHAPYWEVHNNFVLKKADD